MPGLGRPRPRALLCGGLLVTTLFAVFNCTTTRPHQVVDNEPTGTQRVLLMPSDVVVLQVGATGLPLLRQAWTTRVEDGFATTARDLVAAR